MTMIPVFPATPASPPLYHREGGAQATYRPTDPWEPLQFVLDAWPHPVTCTEREWLELVAAVSSVLAESTGPLTESRRVAARVARLGEGGSDGAR